MRAEPSAVVYAPEGFVRGMPLRLGRIIHNCGGKRKDQSWEEKVVGSVHGYHEKIELYSPVVNDVGIVYGGA